MLLLFLFVCFISFLIFLFVCFLHCLITGRSNLPQVKRNLISSLTNFIFKLPYKIPNNSQPKNFEILEKCHIWEMTQPSALSPKLIFCHNSQKVCKGGNQSFLVLSNFTEFLYCLGKQIFCHNSSQSHRNFFCYIFYNFRTLL